MASSSSAGTLSARVLVGLLILGALAACGYDLQFALRFGGTLALLALVLAGGCRLSASLMRRAHPSEVLLAAGTTATALVVLTTLLLCLAGWLSFWTVLAAHLVTWLVVRRMCKPGPAAWPRLQHRLLHPREPGVTRWAKLTCLATVLAAGALGIFNPKANYDAIGYHLTAAATWLNESGVRLVPTPFGDNGQAYMPANFELIQTWLMLALHDDLLARAGQFPFLGMIMLAGYVMARNLSMKRRYAMWAALTLLLCRHLLVQSGSAMVDVATAAFVLGFLALAATFGRTGQRYALICAGLSLGLAVGTKFLVLALLPLVLPLAALWAWPVLRRRPVQSVALLLVSALLPALYWYARNAWLTGNPLYPLRVTLGGHVLLPGAYGRDIMQHWLFNRSNRTDLVEAVLEVFGPIVGRPMVGPWWLAFVALPLVWLVGVCCTAIFGRRKRIQVVCLLLAVPAMLAIQWFVVPYQEPRFFFVPLGLLCAGLAVAASANRVPRLFIATILIAHLLVCARWYALLVALLAVGVIALFSAPLLRRFAARKTSWGLAAVILWWVLAWGAAPERTRPRAFVHHPRFCEAWTWTDANIHEARIGYAGHNIPYFLFGPQLRNEVMPINVDRHLDFAFHDYAAADNEMTRAEAFTPEAAYYRARLDHRAWMNNIEQLRLDYLVISTVAENQMLTIRHDAEGFPIEARWAARSAGALTLVYEDRHTRIYGVGALGPAERRYEPAIIRAEPDCFGLRRSDPGAYAELYPWAEKKITETPRLRSLLAWLDRQQTAPRPTPRSPE